MKKAKFIRIRVKNRKTLENADLDNVSEEIKSQLFLLLAEMDQTFEFYQDIINNSLSQKMLRKISKINAEDITPAQKVRKMKVGVAKVGHNLAKSLASSDVHQQVNQAELQCAQAAAAAGVTQFKKWVTQFDSRVRPWHDVIMHQTRHTKDYFDVPVAETGMVDKAKHPKSQNMHQLNFMNCRCFMEFEIV